MAQYFVVVFKNASIQEAKLETWLGTEGTSLSRGNPLLSYEVAGKSGLFNSPVSGTLKVQLYPEGQLLADGSEIAVLSVEDTEAQAAVRAGHGRIIKPEELDETIAHAEEASIRLPPQPS